MPMPRGFRHTATTRAAMRAAHLGHRHSLETRAKLSAALIGNQRTLGNLKARLAPIEKATPNDFRWAEAEEAAEWRGRSGKPYD